MSETKKTVIQVASALAVGIAIGAGGATTVAKKPPPEKPVFSELVQQQLIVKSLADGGTGWTVYDTVRDTMADGGIRNRPPKGRLLQGDASKTVQEYWLGYAKPTAEK